jgi:hypothetical protein
MSGRASSMGYGAALRMLFIVQHFLLVGAAVVLTVFEGFYDIGTIGRCGALAATR